jgi:hypothetical protein
MTTLQHMDDLVSAFDAYLHGMGDTHAVTFGVEDGAVRYRITKVGEGFLGTPMSDLIQLIARRAGDLLTVIDLSGCRVVSSLELTLIGSILFQTRRQGGRVRFDGANPVNERALRMVGFDRLLNWKDGLKPAERSEPT